MSHVIDQGSRTFILSMDAADALEALKVAGGLAGGALGVKFFDWFTTRKKDKRRESGEWQIKVIDAGEHMREERAAEARALRLESSANLERAHRAEMSELTLRNENITLRSRLDRKDEQYKVLVSQLFRLGKLPATMEPDAEWPSGEVPIEGGNGNGTGLQHIDPERPR